MSNTETIAVPLSLLEDLHDLLKALDVEAQEGMLPSHSSLAIAMISLQYELGILLEEHQSDK